MIEMPSNVCQSGAAGAAAFAYGIDMPWACGGSAMKSSSDFIVEVTPGSKRLISTSSGA
jgi:hypothetical protein